MPRPCASWWQRESFTSLLRTSLQAPTSGKPIWSPNATFLWLTWVAVQRNTCCSSKAWTSACHSLCHPWIWRFWLSLFSSWHMARAGTADVSRPFSLHVFTSGRDAPQLSCSLAAPLRRTAPAWTKGHILLVGQAANKAFNIDSTELSKTTVDTRCLGHCW